MMRIIAAWFLVLAAMPLAAYARQPADNTQTPAAAKKPAKQTSVPKQSPDEEKELDTPAEMVRTITVDSREQGVVTGVTVMRGNNTYYLRPNTPAGSALPGDAQSPGSRPAQWQILEFDWKRRPDNLEIPSPSLAPPSQK